MATLIKYRKEVVLSSTLVFFFIMANLAFAETKVFVEEYTYQASEYDSKVSCRVLALEQVKRLLLEKLGIYLESETEVKNFQLTKDQIVILTAGIVNAEIIAEKWDGKSYWMKAVVTADTSDVAKSIDALRKDREKTIGLGKIRHRLDELLRENDRLRRELAGAKGQKNQEKLTAYDETIKEIMATQRLFMTGIASFMSGKPRTSIDIFNKIIELDPNSAVAYFNRGAAHHDLGNYGEAIKDYNKAIDLNPKDSWAYYNRGLTYDRLDKVEQAIKDYTASIKLYPGFDKAYHHRGLAYGDIGDHRQAINDFNRAIELNPKFAEAYRDRGVAYHSLGDKRQAIMNFDQAIEINPKFARAYKDRGYAYYELGNEQQAIEDYKWAASLGDRWTQDFLRSRGIAW